MENWNRVYVEQPEVFEAFCRAEDPDGRITDCLRRHGALDGKSVVEIGCGTGRYTWEWSSPTGRYVAVDRVAPLLALARRNPASSKGHPLWVCADAAHLPLADHSVDRVLAGWVVINLRPATRLAVLRESLRVLRREPGAGTWLVENHWSGRFQRLRAKRSEVERARVQRLIDDFGFALVEVVRTALSFPSAAEAERILGRLCGDEVGQRLCRAPAADFDHQVVILHRPATRSPGP